MIPPIPHIMDIECTPFWCVSTFLFCAAVVCLATFWPYIQEKILKALENWKIRIFLSLIIAVAFSYFWDTLSYASEAFFLLVGGHRSTIFFLSLIACYVLYCVDVKRKKGLKFTSLSIFPLLLFAIEWARLEGYPLVLVASACFLLSLLLLPWLGASFVYSSEQEGNQKEKVQELLGREVMYKRLHFKIRHMMKEETCRAVVIYGRWGEGKTHLIRYLIEKLRSVSKQKEGSGFYSILSRLNFNPKLRENARKKKKAIFPDSLSTSLRWGKKKALED